MRRALIPAFLLLLGSTVLGATVLREPLASAATSISSLAAGGSAPVTEQNVDTNGNIKVHEQGVANVNLTSAGQGALDNANAHLASIDAQTSKLNFDGSGDLKTAPQGTQTVHVDNSSLATSQPAATKSFGQSVDISAGDQQFIGFGGVVNASLIIVAGADDSVFVDFRNAFGGNILVLRGSGEDGTDQYELPSSQPIATTGVNFDCRNLIEDCKLSFQVVGS
jgi:hypothetical protein